MSNICGNEEKNVIAATDFTIFVLTCYLTLDLVEDTSRKDFSMKSATKMEMSCTAIDNNIEYSLESLVDFKTRR